MMVIDNMLKQEQSTACLLHILKHYDNCPQKRIFPVLHNTVVVTLCFAMLISLLIARAGSYSRPFLRARSRGYVLRIRGFASEASQSTETPRASVTSDSDMLLNAMLPHVPQLGWSDAAISAAVRDLGWSPAAKGLLSHGPASAVLTLVSRFNRTLAVELASEPGVLVERPNRAAHAIRTRIEMATPYHHTWPQALGLLSLPHILPSSVRASACLADEIAHFAGYRTTDVCPRTKNPLDLNIRYTTGADLVGSFLTHLSLFA